jgi:hypothetical protein
VGEASVRGRPMSVVEADGLRRGAGPAPSWGRDVPPDLSLPYPVPALHDLYRTPRSGRKPLPEVGLPS